MELPAELRRAIDRAVEEIPSRELERAVESLSARYRAELCGRHVDDDASALAYLAARLPATYAAIRSCLDSIADMRPAFSPQSLLDVGAGPGTALWAVASRWPTLGAARLLEQSSTMRRWGALLAAGAVLPPIDWLEADLRGPAPELAPHDLVVIAYVLNELEPTARAPLLDRLWDLTGDILLLVEPGTPTGWQRILAARQQLLARGAAIVAPCPHAMACPLATPDWCHFARRVARSRLHRRAKGADVPWEDEKFIYLALARHPVSPPSARVIAPPRAAPGHVRLKLCLATGHMEQRIVSRRAGTAYRQARRLGWGDPFMP
jgi:ribosomal protein RSM22 (predicted rRNA methylase)